MDDTAQLDRALLNGKTLYVAAAMQTASALTTWIRRATPRTSAYWCKIPRVPAGLRVDEKGNLYVAAERILVFSPDGKQLGTFGVKERASNLAFGLPDGKTLFVTAMGVVYRTAWTVKGLY